MTNLSLQEIGLKHGTDKAHFHKYLDFYEEHLPRNSVYRLLEIGILGGASLKTWREWLPETALVEGWDIDPQVQVEGCSIKRVDQANPEQLLTAVGNENWDVILDDGGHTPQMMQTSFSVLFPYCTYYVIEDLHAPWVHPMYLPAGDTKTNELVEDIKNWDSKYSTPEQADYIRKNAEVVAMLTRHDENGAPQSMTAIIRNITKSPVSGLN